MNNAQRALLVAAGLFLTIALITLVVNLFGSAQDASKQAQSQFAKMTKEMSDQTFDIYDNTILSGSQVLNAIRKFQNQPSFGIQVQTGKNAAVGDSGSWYNNTVSITGGTSSSTYGTVTSGGTGSLDNAQNESDNDYVNPSGQFKGTVIRDKSNAIRGIVFRQQ